MAFSADEWNYLTPGATTGPDGSAQGGYGIIDPGTHTVTATLAGGRSASASCMASDSSLNDSLSSGLSSSQSSYQCCLQSGYFDNIYFWWQWNSVRTNTSWYVNLSAGPYGSYSGGANEYSSSGTDSSNMSACYWNDGTDAMTLNLLASYQLSGGGYGWLHTATAYCGWFTVTGGC